MLGVGASCLTLSNYIVGSFVIPLGEAFGWSRAQILLGQTSLTATTLIASLIIGALTDRLPLKRLILFSQIGFALAFFALAAFTTADVRVFYALHVLMAILAAGTLPMTFTRLVSVEFDRRRGLAIGLMLAGTGLCGLVVSPTIAWVIGSYGWRAGYVAAGIAPLAVALCATLWLIPDDGERRGAARILSPLYQAADITVAKALRDRRFWTMALALFLASGVTGGTLANFVPILRDDGLGQVSAASVVSVFGLAVIAGRIIVGLLVDRFWAPPIALALMVPAALASWCLTLGAVGVVEAYAIALFVGLAAGVEADLMAYLTGRYFGLGNIGKLYAILFVFFTAGIGLAVPSFGRVFDLYHSYNPALYASTVIWVLCGVLFLTLGPYPASEEGALPDALAVVE